MAEHMHEPSIEHLRRRLSLRGLYEEAGAIFHGSVAGRCSSHCPLHGGDNLLVFRPYANETKWRCMSSFTPESSGASS